MATRNNTNTTPTNSDPKELTVPAAWGTDGEDFEGRAVIEKETLLGKPFMILGYEVVRSNRGYDTIFINALDTEGNEFEFSDSSTSGIKAQLQELATARNLNPAAGGGWVPFKLRVWEGLRVHVRDIEDENTGKVREATTYYLAGRGIKRSN